MGVIRENLVFERVVEGKKVLKENSII